MPHANLVALMWGWAEAVFFFIVPDVWLSLIAQKSLKQAIVASLIAVAGALAGGAMLYAIASQYPAEILCLIEKIPAISAQMLTQSHINLEQQGGWALMIGPMQGVPYKTFASQAPQAGISLLVFLAYSIPARLFRFLAVSVMCFAATRWLTRRYSPPFAFRVLMLGWVIFYVLYFWHMPS